MFIVSVPPFFLFSHGSLGHIPWYGKSYSPCSASSLSLNCDLWIFSSELPYGWERQITEDGKVFFVDHINHKTTYTDPRLAFAVEESNTINDLRQRFDSSSTGLQVLHGRDLTGRVAVITGANSGIGEFSFQSLSDYPSHVCFVPLRKTISSYQYCSSIC